MDTLTSLTVFIFALVVIFYITPFSVNTADNICNYLITKIRHGQIK